METESPLIVHFLYEPGDGGLDRVAILLANGMARRGKRTELWMAKAEGQTATLIDKNRVRVRIVPSISFGSRGLRLLYLIPALAKMMRQHRPAFMISAGNQSNLVIALARKLTRTTNTAVVQKITNPIKRPGMSRLITAIRTARFQFTVGLGDMCLTLSESDVVSYVRTMPKAADKFCAVHNAYVTDEMLKTGHARTLNDPKHPLRLLAVGRTAFQKDYETMLRALALLANVDWSLTILGDGPLMEEAQALALELSITDRIIFAGFVTDPISYYASSDILILSSRWEGFPAVPLEAMASGCDIVATDCARGLNDILNDIGRTPAPVEDHKALADHISAAIKNPADRSQMIAIAKKYSIELSIDDHLRLLREIKPLN